MRFLVDECLPPSMAGLLRAAGHDCAHIYEIGLGGQPDEQIMNLADRENRILISADTDFGELLANAPVLAPSVILLRRTDKRASSLAVVVLANLGQVTGDLAAGALVVISDTRVRTRRLPVKPSDLGQCGTEPSDHVTCVFRSHGTGDLSRPHMPMSALPALLDAPACAR